MIIKESKIVKYEKNGRSFEIELIWNLKNKTNINKDEVQKIMKMVATNAGQDPGEYSSKWFELADNLAIAYCEERVVGFAVSKYIGGNTVFFPVTMVIPEFQFSRLGRIMNFYLLRHFFLESVFKGKKLWPVLYLVFRTQNPVLYNTWMKHITVFPKLDGTIPDNESNHAQRVVQHIWPDADFNKSTFVITNAYKNAPGLRIAKESIPLSTSQIVNTLFEKKLKLSSDSYSALLVLGKIHTVQQYFKLIFGGSFL